MKRISFSVLIAIATLVLLSGCLDIFSGNKAYCGSDQIAAMMPTVNSMEIRANSSDAKANQQFCNSRLTNITGQYRNVETFYSANYYFTNTERGACKNKDADCLNTVTIVQFKTADDAINATDALKQGATSSAEVNTETVGMNKIYSITYPEGTRGIMWRSSVYIIVAESRNGNTANINSELELGLLSKFPSDIQ